MEKALLKCIIKKTGNTYRFVGSDETIDRDGEIIKVDGWDLRPYRKNSVLLWAHRHDIPAVGTTKVKIENGKLIFYDVKFAEPGTYDLADTVHSLVDQDILKAVSVAYKPIEREYPREGEQSRGKKAKPDIITMKAELYELSLVNVGANPNALREIKSAEKEYWKKELGDIEKGAIGYKKTGKDPIDAAWDAGKEVKAADISDLKIMCTWVGENADIKSSYKLPHHRADNHNVVWKGVSAAMAALLGARGGVNIPEEDRKGVYNHLAKHYKEFDKPVPDFKSIDEIMLDTASSVEEIRRAIKSLINKNVSKYDVILGGEADPLTAETTRKNMFAKPKKLKNIFGGENNGNES